MIGILGGYGAVGSEVARLLLSWGETRLRLGGRNPQPIAGAQCCRVDVQDLDSLMTFCSGCRLIINCAAPSCRLSCAVARQLVAANIPLVDAGGVNCLQQLDNSAAATAVFAAGALPGLSGLLPLWLAQAFERVTTLRCWFSVFDRFTPAGAEDYLDGVISSTGTTTRRQQNVTLPFFTHPVTLQPYQDAESQWVEQQLGLKHSQWYLALAGEHLASALDGARMQDRKQAIASIVRGSQLDVAGRTPSVTFMIQLEGRWQGKDRVHTLLLRAPGIANLTAACAAATGKLLIKRKAPVFGLAAECIDPESLMLLFCREQTGIDIELFNHSVEQLSEVTGGAL